MTNIKLYTKAYCPYCKAAKALLTNKGLTYKEIDVENDGDAFQEMITLSNSRRTVPQVFFDEIHIGGYDDLAELEMHKGIMTLVA